MWIMKILNEVPNQKGLPISRWAILSLLMIFGTLAALGDDLRRERKASKISKFEVVVQARDEKDRTWQDIENVSLYKNRKREMMMVATLVLIGGLYYSFSSEEKEDATKAEKSIETLAHTSTHVRRQEPMTGGSLQIHVRSDAVTSDPRQEQADGTVAVQGMVGHVKQVDSLAVPGSADDSAPAKASPYNFYTKTKQLTIGSWQSFLGLSTVKPPAPEIKPKCTMFKPKRKKRRHKKDS